ncbi:hypothetical protein [Streptomyces marincola]|uniref:MYXO-CTERM domain-containing protein n=1 Tax=Streptomyces marincola TaxID=2878388 RepID=A0A1W7CYD9_9ACTN|nr:hypothetical protein [Streptomyces marincola]ARQ69828.1 hypothetical protein CAG99_14000 [Streptomyces marincola]
MAAAAVIALFVPSALAGDPPSGNGLPRVGQERVGEERVVPDGRGAVPGGARVRAGEAPVGVETGGEAGGPAPSRTSGAFAARPGGEVLPVLPLGAGLACLGLGLGALGLRLRRV